MDFYHSWLYRAIINTHWFMWIVIYVTLGTNVLAPVIVWYFINGRQLLRRFWASKKRRSGSGNPQGSAPG
ncbi:hypothetical protein SAMN02799624_03973 [Paenibacillus sp. UNC496MF]|uniref:hypothetical protein n=1 Tax=Paenibacillus sp. UNC496MF TaxID=1502753 RepID=UPI0008EFF311|nr:hypothetical protein [Paenibacillus sp. UNC496MF]SFJ30495.1 hypothetical protein SAMN02799624_03973 [Paenibacillus sp. UNC496MF]